MPQNICSKRFAQSFRSNIYFTLLSYERTIVLGAYQDDAGSRFSRDTCGKALKLIGAVDPLQTGYRASFAIAGYKGKNKPYFVQQRSNPQSKGPTDLKNKIILNA